MSKSTILAIALLSCFVANKLLAGVSMSSYTEKTTNYGMQTYGKETLDKIQANGFVKLNGTKITEYLQINGRLKADYAQIEKMTINGQGDINNCFVRQKSLVCGTLIATSSKFSDELSVSSEIVVFNSCALSSLRILSVGGYQGVQVVELRGATQINGPITFESGQGEVLLDPDSEIIGKIIGGKIIK